MFTYIINPQPISHQTIRTEIAKTVNTAVENILRFEYWSHQLWAHIEGVGGRIISYLKPTTVNLNEKTVGRRLCHGYQ